MNGIVVRYFFLFFGASYSIFIAGKWIPLQISKAIPMCSFATHIHLYIITTFYLSVKTLYVVIYLQHIINIITTSYVIKPFTSRTCDYWNKEYANLCTLLPSVYYKFPETRFHLSFLFQYIINS